MTKVKIFKSKYIKHGKSASADVNRVICTPTSALKVQNVIPAISSCKNSLPPFPLKLIQIYKLIELHFILNSNIKAKHHCEI